MNANHEKASLRRQPYRGILTEIAREEGVTRQAVQKRTSRGNPDTLARIAAKVHERAELRYGWDQADGTVRARR